MKKGMMFCLAAGAVLTVAAADFQHGLSGTKPWTDEKFLDDPQEFHFAIIGDRTGGERRGFFEKAMDALNLLRPEFAICVGDLIANGSAPDAKRQWEELNRFTARLEMPFFHVVGNHDIRGVDAYDVYEEYMPQRMSQELNRTIDNTTFAFTIGPDAFIVINFNDPEDDVIEKLLDETKDARYTFIITHGPVLPFDDSSCRWFLYGGRDQTLERLHYY